MTFDRLATRTDDVMAALNGWGIGRDDRVALLIPDRARCAAAFLTMIGCSSCICLDPSLSGAKLEALLDRLAIKALVATEDFDGQSLEGFAEKADLRLITLLPAQNTVTGDFTLAGGRPGEARMPGPAAPDDEGSVFLTSGSTGVPRAIPLTQKMVVEVPGVLRDLYGLSAADRFLNFMPIHHIHGLLYGVTLPLSRGGSVVIAPEFDADRFFDWLTEYEPTWYSGSQVFHHVIARSAAKHMDKIEGHSLRFIRAGSSMMPAALARRIEEIFGVPLSIVYATTETGVICATSLDPGDRDLETVGRPLEAELSFLGADGRIAVGAPQGEIVARGPSVMSGYDNDEDATREAFVDGWARTGDIGALDDRGFLRIIGRAKEIIIRGGKNIAPGEIEDVLLKHPDIDEAVCFPIPHPTLGEDVAVAIKLRPGATLSQADINAFASAALPMDKAPRRSFLVDEIPRGAVGKPMRLAMAEALRAEWDPARPDADDGAAPAAVCQGEVAQLLTSILGVAAIGPNDNLFDLGLDSLTSVEILTALERDLGVDMTMEALWSEAVAVSRLEAYVAEARRGPAGGLAAQRGTDKQVASAVGFVAPQRSLVAKDFLESATLPFLYAASRAVPERHWQSLCVALGGLTAKAIPWHGRKRVREIRRIFGSARQGMSDIEIAKRVDGAAIERRLRSVVGVRPENWTSPVRLQGQDHIDRALQGGRGVIIWLAPTRVLGQVAAWSIKRAGYPVSVLGRPNTGFSATEFGKRFLNRFSVTYDAADDAERIVIDDNILASVQTIRERLRDNRVVMIAATRYTDRPVEKPFLESSLTLDPGPARLAMATGAALLPAVAVRAPDGGFEIVIEAPIEAAPGADPSAAADGLIDGYVALLEKYALRYPADWGRWSDTWQDQQLKALAPAGNAAAE